MTNRRELEEMVTGWRSPCLPCLLVNEYILSRVTESLEEWLDAANRIHLFVAHIRWHTHNSESSQMFSSEVDICLFELDVYFASFPDLVSILSLRLRPGVNSQKTISHIFATYHCARARTAVSRRRIADSDSLCSKCHRHHSSGKGTMVVYVPKGDIEVFKKEFQCDAAKWRQILVRLGL